MKTALLFPGQGAQAPGMAQDLFNASQEVRDTFDLASTVAKKDIAALMFSGTEDDLKSTDNTQIAMTVANLASAIVLKEKGIVADYCAGFSVGEYAALAWSGILSFKDCFKAVIARGSAMEAASRRLDTPEGNAGMSAILGLPFDEAAAVVKNLNSTEVFIANHSSPSQIVIAGTARGLEAAEAALNEAGAMKVVRLKVSGPFHSPLLAQAREQFQKDVSGLAWNSPRIPVISNVSAKPITSGIEAQSFAGEQIVSMVRWVDSMKWLHEQGVSRVVESGPGKVLAGLWKSFNKDIKCGNASTLDAIQQIANPS